MRKFKDVKAKHGSLTGSSISLEKLVGKKIIEVQGSVCTEFDKYEPCFKINRIFFDDGSDAFVNGEHDIAYLESLPGVESEELVSIYNELYCD